MKLSRRISQTPWLVEDDEQMVETSVEEVVGGTLKQHLNAGRCTVHGSRTILRQHYLVTRLSPYPNPKPYSNPNTNLYPNLKFRCNIVRLPGAQQSDVAEAPYLNLTRSYPRYSTHRNKLEL